MGPNIREILRQVESWSEEDQEELADVVRIIEARRSGIYRLSEDERAAVRKGMTAARGGEFVADDELEKFYRLHRNG